MNQKTLSFPFYQLDNYLINKNMIQKSLNYQLTRQIHVFLELRLTSMSMYNNESIKRLQFHIAIN